MQTFKTKNKNKNKNNNWNWKMNWDSKKRHIHSGRKEECEWREAENEATKKEDSRGGERKKKILQRKLLVPVLSCSEVLVRLRVWDCAEGESFIRQQERRHKHNERKQSNKLRVWVHLGKGIFCIPRINPLPDTLLPWKLRPPTASFLLTPRVFVYVRVYFFFFFFKTSVSLLFKSVC